MCDVSFQVWYMPHGICRLYQPTPTIVHQRIIEHTRSRSSIGKHMKQYGVAILFFGLKKCRNKLDCLVYTRSQTIIERTFGLDLNDSIHSLTMVL